MAGTIRLAHLITRDDVDAALRDVESACSIETANLFRALSDRFRLLADGACLATDLAYGTDENGQTCLFLLLRYPDASAAGQAMQS